MSENNIKELLKGKTIDELLDLVILGLQTTDIDNTVIKSFKGTEVLVDIA
ncbi:MULTISPECIES: hypothetical protein [Cetobacterium]|jgi:hypothetical protein|uniref:Uncharacterized protein n=1 Tax=Candidatus Cetobacterium colombiensis TaxID=3073100 RepID=A0ABU4WAZ6_9FUSO|nr:hypothetical protein [Candidatus Cetobacterium colombiensis]MDX8336720.1 hypothetical protein [Candidatus Cetobacterium colombiensis]